MQENKQAFPKETQGKKIRDLFKNETFLKYSPLFYESPKTITQVSEETGVSRKTIYDQLDNFLLENGEDYDPNYITVKWKGRMVDKPLLFTNKIVIDFIKCLVEEEQQQFPFTQDEEKMLLTLMSLSGIDNSLRKQSKNWFSAFGRLTAILVIVPFYSGETDKRQPILLQKIPIEKLSGFKLLTSNEVIALNTDLQRFVKDNKASKSLSEKFFELEIPIFSTPRDFLTLTKDQVEIIKYVVSLISNERIIGHTCKMRIWQKIQKDWGIRK